MKNDCICSFEQAQSFRCFEVVEEWLWIMIIRLFIHVDIQTYVDINQKRHE